MGLYFGIPLQQDNITETTYGITSRNLITGTTLWDHITGVYYEVTVRDYIKESYYGNVFRNYITGLYYGIIL